MNLTQYAAKLQTCSETDISIKGKSSTITIKAHTIDDAMAIAEDHRKGNQYVAHIIQCDAQPATKPHLC